MIIQVNLSRCWPVSFFLHEPSAVQILGCCNTPELAKEERTQSTKLYFLHISRQSIPKTSDLHRRVYSTIPNFCPKRVSQRKCERKSLWDEVREKESDSLRKRARERKCASRERERILAYLFHKLRWCRVETRCLLVLLSCRSFLRGRSPPLSTGICSTTANIYMTSAANHTALLQHPKRDPRRDSLHESLPKSAFILAFFSGTPQGSVLLLVWRSCDSAIVRALTTELCFRSPPPPKLAKTSSRKTKKERKKNKILFNRANTSLAAQWKSLGALALWSSF